MTVVLLFGATCALPALDARLLVDNTPADPDRPHRA